MESSEIEPYKYSQLIFDKEAKAVQQNKGSLFNEWTKTTEHPDIMFLFYADLLSMYFLW